MRLSRILFASVLALASLAALGGCVAGGDRDKATDPHAGMSAPAHARPEVRILPGELGNGAGDPLDWGTFARQVERAAYILVGESHTSACDHRVQADILTTLDDAAKAAGRPSPALGLEMVPVDAQPVLDRFNAGEFGVGALEAQIDWENIWGHPFAVYAPVFRVAAERGVPLVALNVPRRVVKAVSQGGVGNVADADKPFLPAEILLSPKAQRDDLRAQFELHKGMMGDRDVESELDRFVLVQSLWDTAMAEAAVAAHKQTGRPLVIIAGSGHVEYKWGIADRLRRLDPGAGQYTVMPWRGMMAIDPQAADAFFYCVATHSSRLGFVLELLDQGVKVLSTMEGSKAAKAGFRKGDVILKAQGLDVDSLWVLHKAAIKAKKEDSALTFHVLRGGAPLTLTVPLTGVGEGKGEAAE